ncbi:MAG: haloacid dehalogenase-like hydrolase [Nanoarchaeota archaeon]|nr:haloacid dehalogenase-like hydrolase [Nanoarchaeota archaeon]
MDEIVIVDPEKLEKIKKNISKSGVKKFHVISDFDRTLTKAFAKGQKSPTVIAQIRNSNYLGEEYVKEAHRLFDLYRPIEINPKLDNRFKRLKMHEWWKKHFELLCRCGITRQLLQEIVAKKTLEFRAGSLEFIDYLHENNIPLLIMSAGPGDMIKMYLEQEGRLYDNVHIIANFFKFNRNGKAIGLNDRIIHSLNKDEASLKGTPIYDQVKNRKNVLLLGDSLEDIDMIKGFPYNNLIRIGYLNEDEENNLGAFRSVYDAVLLNDRGFDYINELVKEILR